MKKIMAICLAIVMALSMCTFTVMAAEVDFTESEFAKISSDFQSWYYVTENLVLNGHKITSSNTAIITDDGTVTRPLFKDEKVTLTVDDGEPFDVIVRGKVIADEEPERFENDGEHSYYWHIITPENNTPSYVSGGSFNLIIGDTTVRRTYVARNLPELSHEKEVFISFDVTDFEYVISAGVEIRVWGEWYDVNGNKIGGIGLQTVGRMMGEEGFKGFWMYEPRTTHVEFGYNPSTGEVWGNGGKKSGVNLLTGEGLSDCHLKEGYTVDDVASVKLNRIAFTNAGGGCGGRFSIDNFAVSGVASAEEILAYATEAEKALYYSKDADAGWTYATDGGYYLGENSEKLGLIRFLFDAEINEIITESGIKYIKAENIIDSIGDATFCGESETGSASTFFGDIVNITEDKAENNYYAVAYIIVNGKTYWSAPQSVKPDFNKLIEY